MRIEKLLLLAYGLFSFALAIAPYDRDVWLAENVPMWVILLGIMYFRRRHAFSYMAYACMGVLLVLHTIGGHYTFERVPFDWISQLFGFERNHYDRLAHFSVGFYAYPIVEYLFARNLCNSRGLGYLFGLFSIVTVAGAYEIIEWLYAISADPEAGIAVLGSQGDMWDAQKDMLADTLGAIFILIVFWFNHRSSKIQN